MTVYGTKIKSDIDFSLDLSHETEIRCVVELSFRLSLSPDPYILYILYILGASE